MQIVVIKVVLVNKAGHTFLSSGWRTKIIHIVIDQDINVDATFDFELYNFIGNCPKNYFWQFFKDRESSFEPKQYCLVVAGSPFQYLRQIEEKYIF